MKSFICFHKQKPFPGYHWDHTNVYPANTAASCCSHNEARDERLLCLQANICPKNKRLSFSKGR